MAAAEDTQKVGRRCALGCETWPDDTQYTLCPSCGEPTKRFRGVLPLDDAEAESIKNHANFERYLEATGRD